MKKFLVPVLHMGFVSMYSYKNFWSKSYIYTIMIFMSRERLQVIMCFLHYGEESQHENDCLAKI